MPLVPARLSSQRQRFVRGGLAPGEIELVGTMTERATRRFDDFLHEQWGARAVRLTTDVRLETRPALRSIPTNYHWSITRQIADALGPQPGMHEPSGAVVDCERFAARLMRGGVAEWSPAWGIWPYSEIDEFSDLGWWLSRLDREPLPLAPPSTDR